MGGPYYISLSGWGSDPSHLLLVGSGLRTCARALDVPQAAEVPPEPVPSLTDARCYRRDQESLSTAAAFGGLVAGWWGVGRLFRRF